MPFSIGTFEVVEAAAVSGFTQVSATDPLPVTIISGASGGLSAYSLISDGSTKTVAVKASAGQLYTLSASNVNGSPMYVRLYNKASAPTTGDTPIWRGAIPGGVAGGVRDIEWSSGLTFSTGIAFRLTTTSADNADTAVATGDVMINLGYE